MAGNGRGSWKKENWPNINEHQRKTCNLQLGRQWKHGTEPGIQSESGETEDGKGGGQGWAGAFAICIVCKMLQVNYAELQQQWQKVKVKRTTKWNLHWLSLLSPLSTFYSPPQALFVMSL